MGWAVQHGVGPGPRGGGGQELGFGSNVAALLTARSGDSELGLVNVGPLGMAGKRAQVGGARSASLKNDTLGAK